MSDSTMSPIQGAQEGERTSVDRPVASSAGDTVFAKILEQIVSGDYAPGARLPAERELARMLGASRPTLREALRRLSEWSLIEARRGSGIMVRPPSDWSIEVLPAYLRYGNRGSLRLPPMQILSDLLALRRGLLVELVRLACGRVELGALQGAREAATRAWEARHESAQFLTLDFAVMRQVVEVAGCYPALWLLNRLAGVYFDVAAPLSGVMAPPNDYIVAHNQVFDAIEHGHEGRAVTLMDDYLERHDRRLLGPPPAAGSEQPVIEPDQDPQSETVGADL